MPSYPLESLEHSRSPLTDAQLAQQAHFVNDPIVGASSSPSSASSSTPSYGKPQGGHPLDGLGSGHEKEWQPSGGKETPHGVHELLVDEMFPADSFYKGTYWADLPRGRKYHHLLLLY
jgi:hypothetical protein